MALVSTSHTVALVVLKPATGTKNPVYLQPTNEDLNKFDFAHARIIAQYDPAGPLWNTLIIDSTSYYP